MSLNLQEVDPLVLWHTTKHENVASILQDGFKDFAHLNKRFLMGEIQHQFSPGVWVGDTPALDDELFDGIGLFGFNAERQSFIEICGDKIVLSRAEEWIDPTWPGRQWLVPADLLNTYSRREVSLDDVIRFRLRGNRVDVAKWVAEDRGYAMDFVDRVRRVLDQREVAR